MTDDNDHWHLDLDRIQELAQLELDAGQRERAERDLQRILRFVAEMGEADVPVEGAEPVVGGRLRQDEVREMGVPHWQDNAPQLDDGWFVVPDRPDRPDRP